MVKHIHHPSGATDHAEVSICTCGSLATASVHNVPERSDEERAVSARIIGEGEPNGGQ